MRRSRRLGSKRRGEASDPYWISFTDLLTALLFVFILATLAFMAQVGQKQAELADLEADLTARIEALEDQRTYIGTQVMKLATAEDIRALVFAETSTELAQLGMSVEINEDQSVLSIPSEALGFASGAFDIAPEFQGRAVEIGKVLNRILTQDGRSAYLDTVFVEGHTDGQPFNGLNGTGNWGLSTFRAIALWQLWADRLPESDQLDEMRNATGHNLFSVSGYGDTRPISGAGNSNADSSEDRRIDIRITLVQPSSDDLKSILEETGSEEEG